MSDSRPTALGKPRTLSAGRFGQWLNASISNRITFAALALTMVMVLVIGSVSYAVTHSLIERQINEQMAHDADMAAHRLETALNSVISDLAGLATNSLVANGLVDSRGREVYLVPFLKDYRPHAAVPVSLTLYDFQGAPIAGDRGRPLSSLKGASWIEGVMEKGESRAVVMPGGPHGSRLLLAQPVLYPATGRVEGMLVAELGLDGLFRDGTSFLGGRLIKHFLEGSGAPLAEIGAAHPQTALFRTSRTLRLSPPLATRNFRIELYAPRSQVLAPLYWLAVIYAAVGILTLAVVFWLSREIARRLTLRLGTLSGMAHRIAVSGSPDGQIPEQGDDEIVRLGSAFNLMLLRLRDSYEKLEQRVEERTVELRRREAELRALNENLERRVREEVAKNRGKDHLLIQQSRLAAMGEMIGNIAHQWRQPLNALGLLLNNIQDAYRYNELTKAYLDESLGKGGNLIRKMSATIDDFRNFFRPDREKTVFSLTEAVKSSLSVVEPSYRSHNIAVVMEAVEDIPIAGFPNEYGQVILNLLTNAKDAILEKGVGRGEVEILLRREDGRACVIIRDNGGGIREEVQGKIFDPYFTTKEKGTGIGLYMSKMIIENNMNGKIWVRNTATGAEFTVAVPAALTGGKA